MYIYIYRCWIWQFAYYKCMSQWLQFLRWYFCWKKMSEPDKREKVWNLFAFHGNDFSNEWCAYMNRVYISLICNDNRWHKYPQALSYDIWSTWAVSGLYREIFALICMFMRLCWLYELFLQIKQGFWDNQFEISCGKSVSLGVILYASHGSVVWLYKTEGKTESCLMSVFNLLRSYTCI